jgi:hypothetical protein
MNIYTHMTANIEEKASQKFDKLIEDLLYLLVFLLLGFVNATGF